VLAIQIGTNKRFSVTYVHFASVWVCVCVLFVVVAFISSPKKCTHTSAKFVIVFINIYLLLWPTLCLRHSLFRNAPSVNREINTFPWPSSPI